MNAFRIAVLCLSLNGFVLTRIIPKMDDYAAAVAFALCVGDIAAAFLALLIGVVVDLSGLA